MCKYYFIRKINRIKLNRKNERSYSQEKYVKNIDMQHFGFLTLSLFKSLQIESFKMHISNLSMVKNAFNPNTKDFNAVDRDEKFYSESI